MPTHPLVVHPLHCPLCGRDKTSCCQPPICVCQTRNNEISPFKAVSRKEARADHHGSLFACHLARFHLTSLAKPNTVCKNRYFPGISAKPNCQRSNSVEVNLDGPLSDRETDDCQSTQAKAQERPHILLILADDLGICLSRVRISPRKCVVVQSASMLCAVSIVNGLDAF